MPQILSTFLSNRFVRLFRRIGRNAKKYNEIGFMKREKERLRTEKRWLEGNFQRAEGYYRQEGENLFSIIPESRILNNG